MDQCILDVSEEELEEVVNALKEELAIYFNEEASDASRPYEPSKEGGFI